MKEPLGRGLLGGLSSITGAPRHRHARSHTSEDEKAPTLAVLPFLGIGAYYVLLFPSHAAWTLFLPQALGYLGLGLWCVLNRNRSVRLGLSSALISQGVRWGMATGLVLGLVNVTVILHVIPWLGEDILFLADTPHARAPVWLMLPWAILVIAIFVELNFRGFLLGRLLAWGEHVVTRWRDAPCLARPGIRALAIAISALAFAFDPFMVSTFRHLHWIAVWDGVIWGALFAVQRNLYTVIAAHAVEVMVMYSIIKLTLGN